MKTKKTIIALAGVIIITIVLFAGCGGGGSSPVAVAPPVNPLSYSADIQTASEEDYDPDTDARMAECHTKAIPQNPMFDLIYNDVKAELLKAPNAVFQGKHDDAQKRKALRSLDNVFSAFYSKNYEHAIKILKSKNFNITSTCGSSCNGSIIILRAKIDFLIKFIRHNGFKTLAAAANPAELLAGGTAALTATLTYSDNFSEDVAKYVTWNVAPAEIGSAAGSMFTGATPGTAQIKADLFGWLQSALVAIMVKQLAPVPPTAPPDPPAAQDPGAPQVEQPAPETPPEPPTPTLPPDPPAAQDPSDPPASLPVPFTCGNATSLTPENSNWGIYPDSIVAYENIPGDGMKWGNPIVYIQYDYSMNYTNMMIMTDNNPTGCLLAEGNPGSMLTENIVIITKPDVAVRAFFPDLTTRAPNSNMGVYVAADGSTYWARSDNYTTTKSGSWPDLTVTQALRPEHLARIAK